jgi:PAS domain S-box-containing protein
MTSVSAAIGHGRGLPRRDSPSVPLRLILDVGPFPMWIYDERDLRILDVNERALQSFGYAREQFLAMRVTDLEAAPAPSSPGREPAEAPAGTAKICRQRKADGTVITMRLETSCFELAGRPARLAAAVEVMAQDDGLAEGERRNRELAARELRYRRFFDIASDWFWENDTTYRFTYLSPNIEVAAGLPLAIFMGKRLSEIEGVVIEPEMAERVIAAQRAKEAFSDFRYAYRSTAGRLAWISSTGTPVFGETGAFQGYCGIARDITAQVEAEQRLGRSEQQFRQLLDAAADYYFEQDTEHRVVYLSPSSEALMGIPVAAVLGKRITEMPNISVDVDQGMMAIAALARRLPYRDFVYSRKHPNGKTRWFRTSAAPIFDQNGVFSGYRGVGAEITRHVETEAKIRLAQQRLEGAVAHVTQPIVVYDAEERIVAFNQPFFDLHRVPDGDAAPSGPSVSLSEAAARSGITSAFADPAELQRRIGGLTDGPGQYSAGVNRGFFFREVAEWLLSHGFYASGPNDPAIDLETLMARFRSEAEHSYHLRDGRWMMVVYRRLPGEGRVGLWSDITAIKQAEAERRALEAQLDHARRLEALGTLAGGAAHEINNMLMPVVALTKMVTKKLPEGSRERRNLDTALISAERALELVKQILTFSRMEDETVQASVDVGAVLRQALRRMGEAVPHAISVVEEIAPVPAILGDAGQLQQVIINLLTNALQAIGHVEGRITVSLQPEGADLRLSVADTGCGMRESILARVFEPFFTTRTVGEGTGLGLAVAHGIVKAHGGRIEAKSTVGEGSRFDVFLPIPLATSGSRGTPDHGRRDAAGVA